MTQVRYSLDDVKLLVKKYEEVKKIGSEMIHEFKELINARPEVIHLTEASDRKLSFRFFDLPFTLQLEINSNKIDNSIGVLRTYMDDAESIPLRPLENLEFSFDDGGNIQLKDDLYAHTPEVFPYFFMSKLTEFILSQRIIIKP